MSVAGDPEDAARLRNSSPRAIPRETPRSADSVRGADVREGINVGAPTLKVLLEVSEPDTESGTNAINADSRGGTVPEVIR